jgi:hypothetical protein
MCLLLISFVAIGKNEGCDVHDMVISSPSAMSRVARTVCVRSSVSMTYCALLIVSTRSYKFSSFAGEGY